MKRYAITSSEDNSKNALREVFEDFPVTFIEVMNASLTKEIMQHELYGAVDSMATGKARKHDGIPIGLRQ